MDQRLLAGYHRLPDRYLHGRRQQLVQALYVRRENPRLGERDQALPGRNRDQQQEAERSAYGQGRA